MTPEEAAQVRENGIPFGKPITLQNAALFSDYIKMISRVHEQNHGRSAAVVDGLMHCFFESLADELEYDHTKSEFSDYPLWNTISEFRNRLRCYPYQSWNLESAHAPATSARRGFSICTASFSEQHSSPIFPCSGSSMQRKCFFRATTRSNI